MLTRERADSFLACLNEARYYDAHEVLEAVWFPRRLEKTPEVLLLKGLINASVSFELHKKGRLHKVAGPWKVFLKYRDHLQQVGRHNPLYLELDEAVHAAQRSLNV
jgi:hypothetical protein